MSRHRPSLPAYGGLGGSIAAHHAELPRRACEVCGAGYFGRGPRCPAHAAPYGVEAEAPQGPRCPRCHAPVHSGLCADERQTTAAHTASDFVGPAGCADLEARQGTLTAEAPATPADPNTCGMVLVQGHRCTLRLGHASECLARRGAEAAIALSADEREMLARLAVGEAGHLERRWPAESERIAKLRTLAARLRGEGRA